MTPTTPAPVISLAAYRKAKKRKPAKQPVRLVGTELSKRREEVELRNRQTL